MKRRHVRAEMEKLLERRVREGLTYRELSEESGIPIPTLSYWASKLRREEAEVEARLVEVELVEEGAPITIESQAGLRVTVERGFDAEHLARVLDALARC